MKLLLALAAFLLTFTSEDANAQYDPRYQPQYPPVDLTSHGVGHASPYAPGFGPGSHYPHYVPVHGGGHAAYGHAPYGHAAYGHAPAGYGYGHAAGYGGGHDGLHGTVPLTPAHCRPMPTPSAYHRPMPVGGMMPYGAPAWGGRPTTVGYGADPNCPCTTVPISQTQAHQMPVGVPSMPDDKQYVGKGAFGQPKVYVTGQPLRNAARFLSY